MMRMPWNRTEQERWDRQIDKNREDNAGVGRVTQQIATKMQKCKNNPRNGGRGFDNSAWRVDER
jgi:hypothetical protein